MATILQEDLIFRLQNLQCCTATLSDELLTKIKIGSKDVNCKLEELQVLQRMFKYLKCYHAIGTDKACEVIGIGATLPAIAGEAEPGVNSTISLNVQNILSISMDLSPGSITLQQLVDYINTGVLPIGVIGSRNILVPGIVASLSQNNIILFMPYPEGIAYEGNSIFFSITTPVYDNSLGSNLTEVEGCTLFTEADNCLTDAQVKIILDYTAEKCNHCFPVTG